MMTTRVIFEVLLAQDDTEAFDLAIAAQHAAVEMVEALEGQPGPIYGTRVLVKMEVRNLIQNVGGRDRDPCPICGGDHDRIDRRDGCPVSDVSVDEAVQRG